MMPWFVWVLLAAWLFGPALVLFIGVKRTARRTAKQRREAEMWGYWDKALNEGDRAWP